MAEGGFDMDDFGPDDREEVRDKDDQGNQILETNLDTGETSLVYDTRTQEESDIDYRVNLKTTVD